MGNWNSIPDYPLLFVEFVSPSSGDAKKRNLVTGKR